MARRTEKKNKKMLLALLLLLLAIAIIIGTALAFFSDMGLVTFAGTAGDLTISVNDGVEDITSTAMQYYTKSGVAEGVQVDPTNLNPGDHIVFNFDVENTGSKSAWVRATLGDVLISVGGQAAVVDTNDIFQLLAIPAGDLDDIGVGKSYADLDEYIKAKIEAGYTFTAASDFDAVILSGSEELDGTSDTANLVYILYFDKDAGNTYQGATVAVEIEVEAVQYRNNGSVAGGALADVDWTTVSKVVVGP